MASISIDNERKGLRFEVERSITVDLKDRWSWTLVGADGPVCRSVGDFPTEKLARSNITASKGRMKATRFAKTITVG